MKRTFQILAFGCLPFVLGLGVWAFRARYDPVASPPPHPAADGLSDGEAGEEAAPSASAPRLPDPTDSVPNLNAAENAELKAEFIAAQRLGGKELWADAETALRVLNEKAPAFPEIAYALATAVHMGKKDSGEAMSLLENVVRMKPDFPNVYSRYVEIAEAAQKLDEAKAFLSAEKPRPESLMALGQVAVRLGQTEEAASALNRAAENPSAQQSFAFAQLGDLYAGAKRLDEATGAFENSIKAAERYNAEHTTADNPKDHQSPLTAELKLLDLYLKNKDYDKADALLNKIRQVAPKHDALDEAEAKLRLAR